MVIGLQNAYILYCSCLTGDQPCAPVSIESSAGGIDIATCYSAKYNTPQPLTLKVVVGKQETQRSELLRVVIAQVPTNLRDAMVSFAAIAELMLLVSIYCFMRVLDRGKKKKK